MLSADLSAPAYAGSAGASAVTTPIASTDSTAVAESRVETFRRVFAGATLLYAAYYLAWRWTATLNPDALWFAVPLAIAETFALTTTAFFVFNVWKLRSRTAPLAARDLSVDVFITTYNEPLDLIRKTAIGACRLTYPHRTYILDDGARAEVRALAHELGIEYLRRTSNVGAKAGNLNNALRHTSGDFILQLDADHAPLPHMLDRLLGYFNDPGLAFVQAPQCFYNHDSYTGHGDGRTGVYFAEQDIFFNVIQRGKDRHNAAFFCGSCAVIRRSALESIGGFSAHSITEDFETSLKLHASGWRSAYHCEALAFGLSARTAESFHTQRLRWGRGTLQVLRRFNPLTLKGLTLPQRLCYFYSVLVYLDGLPRLVFYGAPLIYLFAGVLPINSGGVSFLAHFLPLFAASVLLNRVLARGHGAPFWLLERNNLAKVWTHTLALTGYFTRRALRFGVTNKSAGGVGVRHLLPHGLLLAATVAGVALGTAAFLAGGHEYQQGGAAVPFLVNVAWATWNGVVAYLVLQTAIRSRERRSEYRFKEALPVGVAIQHNYKRSHFEIGGMRDLNASGASVRVDTAAPTGSSVQLSLMLPDGPATVRGTVIRIEPELDNGRVYSLIGVSFSNSSQKERDRIALYCLQHITPFLHEQTQSARKAPRLFRNRRTVIRSPLQVAAMLRIDSRSAALPASIANVSDRGACLHCFAPIPEGTMLTYEIPELGQIERGQVVQQRCIATAAGLRYVLNVSNRDATPPRLRRIHTSVPATWLPDSPMTAAARIAVTAATLLVLLAAFVRSASAQYKPGFVAAAEAADNGQRVYLAGVWLARAGVGLAPTASVFGYRIELADNADFDAIWAVNPALGIRYQSRTGALQSTVGYTWQSASGDDLVGEAARVSSGATTAVQGDYWGNGALMLQGIASYSWGGDGYTWTRGRGTVRLANTTAGAFRLGAELGWQGNQDYNALDTGGVVEWHRLPVVVSLSVGNRSIGEGAAQSGPYVSIATVIIP